MLKNPSRYSLWVVIAGVLFINLGCAINRAYLTYEEFNKDMPVRTSSWNGKSLGPVTGEEGGAVWNSCTEKARESMRDLIANVRQKGGNALGDIKWFAGGTSEPKCKKGWGYVVIWPFLLTPLFMSTRVDGIAYKVDNPRAGLWMIPNSPKDDLALANLIINSK
jgi:hypothetical protein